MQKHERDGFRILSDRLQKYSLAAGAVFAAGAVSSRGDVVYSNVNLTLSGTLVVQTLDVNADSKVDFVAYMYGNASGAAQYLVPGPVYETNQLAGSYHKFGTQTTSYTFRVSKLKLGAQIGPSGNLFDTTGNLLGIKTTEGVSSGNFIGQRGYVGVKFISESGMHYGWLDVESSPNLSQMTIHGWAYETTPDMPIGAGAVVPLPGTLAMLATGAAGLLALRRSRQAGCREL